MGQSTPRAPVNVTGTGIQTISVPPGRSVRVDVTVSIPSTIPTTESVSVKFGNTTTVDAQNVQRTADANDVYTADNPNGAAGETAGVPANGVREASVQQSIPLDPVTKQTFVKITTINTGSTPVNGPNGPDGPVGDTLTYNLSLDVLDSLPSGTPSSITQTDDLYPTFVPGLTDGKHVLIFDVIPTGTVIKGMPTVPANSGWEVVYSTDDPALTGNSSYEANWTKWSPTNPPNSATVKRIGFVYTAGEKVSQSPTSITGFSFKVEFTNAIQQGIQITNIAEVFGEKANVDQATLSNSTVPSIFDQSGDSSSNNDSNGDGVPDITPYQSTGIANPSTQGTDSTNNNGGEGEGGEVNVFNVPLEQGDVQNGTVTFINGVATPRPDATGPNGDINQDFTNRSSTVGPNSVPLVTFTNSISLKNAATGNVRLIPLATNLTDLPVGETVITIGTTSVPKVTYTVTQSTAGGIPTVVTSGSPLTIAVPANTSVQYEITVDLPNNATQNTDYDVPITAFIDTNDNGLPDGSENRNNTIDPVYAGFIKLLKKTQVFAYNATTQKWDIPRTEMNVEPKVAAPGEVIKYEITYTNISESIPAAPAQYNVILTGERLKITEDGISGGNNWATDQNGDGIIDTNHVGNGATLDSTNGNGNGIEYFNGLTSLGNTEPATNTVVTRYIDTVSGDLAPNVPKTFTFQRKVN